MTLEQPANLNRLIPGALPSWGLRWNFFKILLPIIAFSTIGVAETVGLRLWAGNELTLAHLGPVILLLPCLSIILLAFHEFGTRRAARSSRLLNVLENGISHAHSGRPLIPWSRIDSFWFEAIPDESQFNLLTVLYINPKKSKTPRRSALVLEKLSQVQPLISELTRRQARGDGNFRIELNHPLPPPSSPRLLFIGMSLYFAGMLLLVHGLPLLAVALQHHPDTSDQTESKIYWSPEQKAKLHTFLTSHFSSQANYKHFLLEAGGTLTIAGAALMLSGAYFLKHRPKTQSSSTTFTAHSG